MRRIVCLLAFFAGLLLVGSQLHGIATGRSGLTHTATAKPEAAGKGEKEKIRPRDEAECDEHGHLKIYPPPTEPLRSPFSPDRPTKEEIERGEKGSGGLDGYRPNERRDEWRLVGLARSENGSRAVISREDDTFLLSLGETRNGLTLVGIDLAGKAVSVKSAERGEMVLRLDERRP